VANGATIFTGLQVLQVVESGGTATDITISNGGTLQVTRGGVANNYHLLPGGALVIGGILSGFTVSSGLTLEASAGTVSNTTVLSGGTLELVAGAKSGTTIHSGGTLEISAGETLSGYHVSGGVTVEALSNGKVSKITVLRDGSVVIDSGGIAAGFIVASAGSASIELFDPTTSHVTIEAARGETASVNGGTVGSGAIVEALSGGTLIITGDVSISGGTLVASGRIGMLEITSGAVVTGGVVRVDNGIVYIQSGGTLNVAFLATQRWARNRGYAERPERLHG
jgi:autotransporter passenger strand-loop-strand repeat protein